MWLKPPTARDICPRKRKTGLSLPPKEYECLVVLDLEWTAWKSRSNQERKPEVIEFGACVVPLKGSKRPVPVKRIQTGDETDEIQLYCKPTECPTLSSFIIDLTGISQETVDKSPTFKDQLKNFVSWLQSLGLVDKQGRKKKHWSMCSWSDADLNVIRNEAARKGILELFPEAFNSWVNLKDDSFFKKTYKTRARGGLENCCKNIAKIGFNGRAHGALTDARNTGALVADMANKLMRFTRSSRGFDKNGFMYGSKRQKRAYENREKGNRATVSKSE
mmetsp:Transcript_2455/g.2855  ORF Transcript_2455/g.2855 Transcript_2455/m.2855 type:complete len:276 (+) Transcript_2455:102-929(+)